MEKARRLDNSSDNTSPEREDEQPALPYNTRIGGPILKKQLEKVEEEDGEFRLMG